MFRTNARLLILTPLVVAAAVPAPEMVLKERDHEKLGKLIEEYFEAKKETSGLTEALEEISEAIEKHEKKTKGVPVLSMVEDLEASVYFARDYSSSVPKGRISEEEGRGFEYAVHAPRKYRPDKGPYPLVLCLPDSGKSPSEHLETNWMDDDLREGAILAAPTMPEDEAAWADVANIQDSAVARALLTLRDVKYEFAVDVDRVFIAGHGASNDAAIRAVQAFPYVFAGAVTRAGDISELSPANFRHVSSYLAGGGSGATAFSTAAKEAGFENVTLDADGTEADIWAWMQERARTAHPSQVHHAPVTLVGGSSYWVEARGFDPSEGPSFTATVDRDANAIEIEASKVGELVVFFNDAIVDMNKPIRITTNGVEQVLELPRRLQLALDLAYKMGDSGRVYTNQHFIEVAAPTEE